MVMTGRLSFPVGVAKRRAYLRAEKLVHLDLPFSVHVRKKDVGIHAESARIAVFWRQRIGVVLILCDGSTGSPLQLSAFLSIQERHGEQPVCTGIELLRR